MQFVIANCTFASYNISESDYDVIVHNPGFGPFEVDVFDGYYIENCKKNPSNEIHEICIDHLEDPRSEAGWEGIYIKLIFESGFRLTCYLQYLETIHNEGHLMSNVL